LYNDGKYFIYQPISLIDYDVVLKSSKLAWLIAKGEYEPIETNEIIAGQYIKFGRVWFKVKETSNHPIEANYISPNIEDFELEN